MAWTNDKQYNKTHTDFRIQVISKLTAEAISLDDSTVSNQSTEAFKGLNGRHFPNKKPVPNTKYKKYLFEKCKVCSSAERERDRCRNLPKRK